MKTIKDITDKVCFGPNDDEALPLTKCICGKTFLLWAFSIGIYKDDPTKCPECGRKLYFESEIRVYETEDKEA